MKSIRYLHLVGATGTIRTAVYDGREHIVIPVIAMVEGVVWASNSDVPEFVPAEELAETPHQWNGRGCFAGHPADDGGKQITANTPRTLETSFGVIFDAVDSKRILETRRLEFFAWLDPVKAEKVGPDAVSVITRARALMNGDAGAQPIEVSVGCFVDSEDIDGTFNRQAYHGVWRSIVSDHVAFLKASENGACSVAAGCGAGRAATRHLITAKGIERSTPVAEPKPAPARRMKAGSTTETEPNPDFLLEGKKRTLRERFKDLFRLATPGWNQSDVREAVRTSLKAIEPLYDYIDDVWEEDGYVVYCVYSAVPGGMLAFDPSRGYPLEPYTTTTYRRDFTMTDEGVVTFADRVEVEYVGEFQPVTAASAAKPCPCGGQPRQATNQPTAEQKEQRMNKETRVKALVDNEHSPLRNQKALEVCTEAELAVIETQSVTNKTVADKAAKDAADKVIADEAAAKLAAAAGKPAQMTEAEAMKLFPRLAAAAAREEEREAAEKATLVESLKACGVKTEDELKALLVAELRTLASFAKVAAPDVDYSGIGAPRTPPKGESYAPPNPYDVGLKALREKTVN